MGTKIEIKIIVNETEAKTKAIFQSVETIPDIALPYVIKCLGMQFFDSNVDFFEKPDDK
jgi:hypothetical protein